jgi:photosystem II stability/assembly factor-like uncharacterized protein
MTGPVSHVYVGAARAGAGTRGGIYRRTAGDGGWERLGRGLPDDTQVQAITIDPSNPEVVYLGSHGGPYRSTDRGESWQKLSLPDGDRQVWSILVHPNDSRLLYAGTSPVGVYRSDDGGDHWRKLATPALPERVRMEFACRVMRLAADPAHPEHVYAALEVGGFMRSLDGGARWEDCSDGLIELAERPHLKSKIGSDTEIEGMMDGHALCVSAAAPDTVFLAVRMGLFRSGDRGRHWEDMEVGRYSPLTYARDVRVSPQDASVLYACLSPAARSKDGSLYRSNDLGATWQRFDREVGATTTMMALALDARNPDRVYCASRGGQVFGTEDGGATWQENDLPEGVRDVYAIACG